MRVVRFAVLVLVCCLAVRESLPLIANHIEALLSHSSSPHQDQLPSQDSELPAPPEESQVEGPISDSADETFSFLPLPTDLSPFMRSVIDRAHPRFASSGELLDALHRLRI
jgi:hypothetical protein